jgi:hypothetical protein
MQAECKRKFTFSLLRRSRFSRAFARNAPFLGSQEGVGVVVTPKPKAWQNEAAPPKRNEIDNLLCILLGLHSF